MFSKFEPKTTKEHNLVITEKLGIELDLTNDSYALFRISNFQATYVHIKSNHPWCVVNQIPKSINKQLTIFKDEYSFKTKEQYQEAINKGCHNTEKRNGNKMKRKIFCTSPHLSVERLRQKSVNDSLKLLVEILTEHTRTIKFLTGNC